MMNLIADKILEKAIEDGKFDLSSKKGDSIRLEENPYQDPTTHLSFLILKNAGMKPPWLELEIEIRVMLEEARKNLVRAAKTWGKEGAHWEDAVIQFYGLLENVNAAIRELNIKVPLARIQRVVIKPQEELEKVLANPHID